MFVGGCIFVDHASGYIHVKFQLHLNSHETLEAKASYKRMCLDHGVVPQKYVADNGSAYTSTKFGKHLSTFRQMLKFAGVGAHHQNEVAERSIGTVIPITRAMLLHSAIHWPDVADPQLWPQAVAHACFLYNHMPDEQDGLSP